MSISKPYILDTWKNKTIMINVKQLDSDRTITFNLKSDGNILNLTDKSVQYYIEKPDKTVVYNSCTVTDAVNGIVECKLTEQSLTVAGTLKMELLITGSAGTESTFTIYLIVLEAITGSGAIASSSEFGVLTDALNKVDSWNDQFETKYNGLETEYATELTDVKTSLADMTNNKLPLKADKLYVESQMSSLVSGGPKGVFATLSALQSAYPTGNTNIYITSDNGNWNYWNGSAWASGGLYQATRISKSSVTVEKTDFITPGINMFDPTKSIDGGHYSSSQPYSTWVPSAGLSQSGFMPCEAGDIIKMLVSASHNVAHNFYYKDVSGTIFYKDVQSPTNNIVTATAPVGAVSVSVVYFTDEVNIIMVVKNQEMPSTFVPYIKGTLNSDVKINYTVPDGSITFKKTDFISRAFMNLFDKSTAQLNGHYNTSSPYSWVSDSTYAQTNFIPCNPGDIIYANPSHNVVYNAFFKDNTGTIFAKVSSSDSTVGSRQFTAPAGTVSVSLILFMDELNTFMVDINNPLSSKYTAYTPTVKGLLNNTIIVSYQNIEGVLPVRWKDKKLACLGDSITYGHLVTTPWHQYLPNLCGFASILNYGLNGDTIANCVAYGKTGFINRYPSMDSSADCITVWGGTNDYNFDVPLGALGSTDNNTFYGALDTLCKGLINKYLGKTIVFFTPLRRSLPAQTTGLAINNNNNTIDDFVKAIKDVCSLYAIPILDLHAVSGFAPDKVGAFYPTYTSDGLHPSDAYEPILANKIAPFINSF